MIKQELPSIHDIEYWRKVNGYERQDIADMCGVSMSAYSKWCAKNSVNQIPLSAQGLMKRKMSQETTATANENLDIESILAPHSNARLTAQKTQEKLNQGYKITGFVIEGKNDYGIINHAACRWLSNSDMTWLMQVSKSPLCQRKEHED